MHQASRYVLAAALCAAPILAQVKMTQSPASVKVEIGGKPFTEFFYGPETTKPYLHPVLAPTGTPVTRFYPMDKSVAGEAQDHIHHQGLWFTHGDVNGVDFWANHPTQAAAKKGKVVLKKLGTVKSGGKQGSIEGVFEWQDASGAAILTETRKMVFHDLGDTRAIDFDLDLKAVQKAVFGDTKEGVFAIRLAPWMEEKAPKNISAPPRTGKMISSEGGEGEKAVWGKRAKWVDYAATSPSGEKVGVAILDHPTNPKHPTYWHSRSYGLFAANIFGEHDFYADKAKDGSVTLDPGKSLRFRYRVIVHPGLTDAAMVNRAYDAFLKQVK